MKLYNVNIDEGYVIPAKNHGSPRSSVRASSKPRAGAVMRFRLHFGKNFNSLTDRWTNRWRDRRTNRVACIVA